MTRATAWSPAEVRVLGVPAGLVPFGGTASPTGLTEFLRAGDEMGVPPAAEEASDLAGANRRRIALVRDGRRAREGHVPAPPATVPQPAAPPPRARWGRRLAAAALLCLAPAFGWWLGGRLRLVDPPRSTPSPTPLPSPAESLRALPEGWTEGDARELDQVLELERSGRRVEARVAASELAARRGNLPNLWQLQALLAMAGRRYAEADVILVRRATSDGPPAELAEALRLRAQNFALQRRLQDTRTTLEALISTGRATAMDHFTLGEALRRLGALSAAVEAFARAESLLSPGREPEAPLAGLRRRLALVEDGREAEIITALTAETSRAQPTPEWCLTAAAVLIQRSDHAGAARWMRAAQESLDADRFFSWTDDYFFRQHLSRPDFRGFFPDSTTRAALLLRRPPCFIDP